MRILAMTCSTLVVAVLAAGCGATRTVVRTITAAPTPPAALGAGADQRLYGRVRSLTREGDHYLLRFDPAWFLSGVTANVAQAEAQGVHCRPAACPPVPNDHFVLDEGHHLLTYIVPAGVRGTVLTRNGQAGGPFPATTITASRLASLVAGRSRLKLFEPLSSGVWILVHGDTVRAFAQQYVP